MKGKKRKKKWKQKETRQIQSKDCQAPLLPTFHLLLLLNPSSVVNVQKTPYPTSHFCLSLQPFWK